MTNRIFPTVESCLIQVNRATLLSQSLKSSTLMLFCALVFQRCVCQGLKDEWRGWEHNEAQEIAAMVNLNA